MLITQGKTSWKFLIIVVVLTVVVGGGTFWFLQQQISSYQTIEIETPEKKSNEECQKYTEAECPEDCIVCPPCEICSSLGCYSAEHCKSMGFDESWYEMIKLQRETADWQTYRNEEIGIEFKYPDNYKIDVTEGHMPLRPELGIRISIIPQGVTPDINNPYIDINLVDSTYFANLNDYISKTYDARISSIGEISVDNTVNNIYKLENSDFFYVFLSSRKSIFNISSPSKDFLAKVLSTFRFIEEGETLGPPCDDLSDCPDFNCPEHGHPDCHYDLECSGGYCICVPFCLP